MLDVYITIDTEIWWHHTGLDDFRGNYDLCFLGRTRAGEHGVPYQIEVFNHYGLKAVFFVESLFASVVGLDPLKEMVDVIQSGGHDVQLHAHTEWLPLMDSPPAPGSNEHMRHFSEDEQTTIIGQALENLRAAGAEDVRAFRAGNYGADLATLRALARNGVLCDTSYNYCYLDSACGIRTEAPLLQPAMVEGVLELPITYFQDHPGHNRHAQIVACSCREMTGALMQAWRRGWQTFTIVSHSFELLNSRRTRDDPTVIRRFEGLCRFLADNRDKFRTSVFDGSLAPAMGAPREPLRGSVLQTAHRVGEQLARRVLFR